ncbi:TlpA disulfide reductase family protein [uncultured Oribacterium sp.]|uniref:TlpA family protein disulfide reductase n=1 Tax=uncultured Oribacterium sp. TaxID=462198 RepID=UPI00280388E8|nr:TlpA disulfide reductase family protein [uncultured Oribacterium sp.]
MKRKKLVLALAILSSLALAACGNSGKTETKVSAETEATTEKATEKAAEKASEKASEAAGEQKASNFSVSDKSLEFTTENLALESVDSSIFGEKDLTVLNVWGTFCGPCIQEMPELGEWQRSLPDNVQIIGLVADVAGKEDADHIELANTILDKTNAHFTNIIPNNDFAELLSGVVGVPTTFFINKEGKIVGKPIVGAQVPKYKAFVEEYLKTLAS